ncbi:Peptidyl-prolyl cis-trans isomerase-like 4 [Metarhizium acridum]|nr:Peptidyl-prolyl cis-trans isomerase-like 4 [Metarhizium acridum]
MSVLLETSVGDIVIDLLVEHAPKLCENFLKLCKVKYYNFSPVHSVQKNFSFQTGDPLGPLSKQSDGGSSIWGYISGDPSKQSFPAFFHPKLKHLERGTVSMATVPLSTDPDTRIGRLPISYYSWGRNRFFRRQGRYIRQSRGRI